MRNQNYKKLLSALLVLMLTFSSIPTGVLAAAVDEQDTMLPDGDMIMQLGTDIPGSEDNLGSEDDPGGDVAADEVMPGHSSVITSFANLDESVVKQSVPFNMGLEDLILPNTLDATVSDGEVEAITVIRDVTWQSEPEYDPETLGIYKFTAGQPEGFSLAEGVELPAITVEVGMSVEHFALPAAALDGGVLTVAVNGTGSGTLENFIKTALNESGGAASSVTALKVTGGADYKISSNKSPYGAYINTMLPNLQTLDLSEFEGTFGSNAFRDCKSVTTVKLPAEAVLASNIFDGCSDLTTVGDESGVVDLTDCHYFEINTFSYCTSITTVKLPANAELSSSMFLGCTSLTTVGDESGVVDLTDCDSFRGDIVLAGCTSITTVKLPEGARLFTSMFSGCTGLTTIGGESGVVDLRYCNYFGNFVFAGCISITTVKLSEGAELSNNMFYNCTDLTTIGDESGVIDLTDCGSFGREVFIGCTSITTVKQPKNAELSFRMFQGCTNLTTVGDESGVVDLTDYDFFAGSIFYGCTSIVTVKLLGEGTMISDSMFRDCTNLTTIGDESGVVDLTGCESFSQNAFRNCTSITTVKLPEKVLLSYGMFSDCTGLTTIGDESGVVDLTDGDYFGSGNVFNGCISITTVKLAADAMLFDYMFSNCTGLKVLALPPTPPARIYPGFHNVSSLMLLVGDDYKPAYATLPENLPAGSAFPALSGTETLDEGNALTLSVMPDVSTTATVNYQWKKDGMIIPGETGRIYTKTATVADSGIYTCEVSLGDIIYTTEAANVTVGMQPGKVTGVILSETGQSTWTDLADETGVSGYSVQLYKDSLASGAAKISSTSSGTIGINFLPEMRAEGVGSYTVVVMAIGNNITHCNGPSSDASAPQAVEKLAAPAGLEWSGSNARFRKLADETNVVKYIITITGLGKVNGSSTADVLKTGSDLTIAVSDPGDDDRFKVKAIAETAGLFLDSEESEESSDYASVNGLSVFYDTQGGNSIEPVTGITPGSKINLNKNPVKEGYLFIGWFSELEGGDRITTETIVTRSMTIYAQWKAEAEIEGMWVKDIPFQTYTGQAIKPAPVVYSGTKMLAEGKDYTVSYRNNTDVAYDTKGNVIAGAKITVKGKGDFSGTETVEFTILPKDITTEGITVGELLLAVTQKVQKPIPVVNYGSKKLANKKDFTVSYPDTEAGAYQAAGTYEVIVNGINNFSGEIKILYVITDQTLITKVKVNPIANQSYTGVGITPEVTVRNGSRTLEEGTDYTLAYQNNIEIGTATVIITGIGSYIGSRQVSFKIIGKNVKQLQYAYPDKITYTGTAIEPEITITDGTAVLEKDTSYLVTYKNNIKAGKASIIITGIGGYSGTVTKTFTITKYNLTNAITGELELPNVPIEAVYSKGGSKPVPAIAYLGNALTAGTDFTIRYKNNTAVNDGSDSKTIPTITISGKSNFTGSLSIPFTISQKPLDAVNGDSSSKVVMTAPDIAFKNKVNTYQAKPVLVDEDGKTLKAGTDYEKTFQYAYKDGRKIPAGEIPAAGSVIRVTVTGMKNYTGELSTEYRIVETMINKTSVSVKTQTYSGEEITLTGEDMTVKVGKTVLVKDTDYEIVDGSYRNNIKKGTANVTIRGINQYGGIKQVKFKIAAKPVSWFWR